MVIKLFKMLMERMSQDPVERYLAESEDLADLESRMKSLRQKGIWV